MSSIRRILGLATALVALTACGGGSSGGGDAGAQPPPTTPTSYSVSTSVTGSGAGTISPTSRTVSHGNTTSFTVSPASGSSISSVSGCGGSLNGTTYTTGQITANCTVTASFETSNTNPPPSSYTVSTTVSGGGNGTISPGSVNVIPGGSASFNIFPDGDSVIAGVSGCDGTLSGNTYVTGVISANCTVAVTFELRQYQVTAIFAEGGTIDPTSRLVAHGSVATFNVLPDEGYSIDQVSGCGGSLSGQTFTTGPITGECSVDATFLINQYTVLATAGENGTISPNSATVDHGQTASFTVVADIGYQVETIGGCGGALVDSTYTTGPITSACSVAVSFAPLVSAGRWDVKIIGRLDPNDEPAVYAISGDGSAVLGASYRFDPATSSSGPIAYRWSEVDGFETLIFEGDRYSAPQAISFDGSVVVGVSDSGDGRSTGFLWRKGFGLEPISLDGFTRVDHISMSTDGSVVWAQLRSINDWTSVIWTELEGLQELVILEGARVEVQASTPDGSVLVGTLCDSSGCDAFRWNRTSGLLDRFKLESSSSARAVGVSADGQFVAGASCGNVQPYSCRGFFWSEASGIVEVMASDAAYAEGREIAANAPVVIGQAQVDQTRRLFRWTLANGLEYLLYEGDSSSEFAWMRGPDIAADGRSIVGRSCASEGTQNYCRGAIWREGSGMQLLMPNGDINDWTQPEGMSVDGSMVVGTYSRGTEGGGFAWSPSSGFEPLVLHQAQALSANGTVIGGLLCNAQTCEAALLVAK